MLASNLSGGREGRRGRKRTYISHVVGGLHRYLRPLYRSTFGDDRLNSERLREQVSRLLSPFFEPIEISPARKGRIWNAINKVVHHAEHSAALVAESGRNPPPAGLSEPDGSRSSATNEGLASS